MKTIVDIMAIAALIWASFIKLLPVADVVAPSGPIVITDSTPAQAPVEGRHDNIPEPIPYTPRPTEAPADQHSAMIPPVLQNPPLEPSDLTLLRAQNAELERRLSEIEQRATAAADQAQEYKAKLEETVKQLKDVETPVPPTPHTPANTSHQHHTSLGPAVRESQDSGKRIFALVVGPGCPKCHILERDVLPTQRWQEEADRFVFTVIDADANPADAEALYGPGTQTFPRVFTYLPGHPETRIQFEPKQNLDGLLSQIQAYSL